jgi:iron complex transport system substrate-binding protein
VFFCAGRDAPGSGHICKLFAAGAKTFYTDLLRTAGCVNACADTHFVYPEISAEGIARMAPDIVIDVMPSVSPVSNERAIADWNSIPLLPAVRAKCVYCLTGDYVTIPGPRIALLYRDIKNIVADARGKTR